MLEEQIYDGVEIYSSGDYCDSIIFIIDGQVIIEIEDEHGEQI